MYVVTYAKEGYVLCRVGLFVCLSVCHKDYLPSNERMCMKLLPEVCIEQRNKQLHFVDDPDYDPYPRSGILFRSRSITIWILTALFPL